MKFSVVSALSALVAVVSAFTDPDYSQSPSGNPIALPGLDELVPVGKPYTITWTPTTPGKVSIILLRGPSSNVVPIDTLADGVDNTGTFIWTPSTSLENDVTHYGLEIIVEGTGQYQYSTQFGIKNDKAPTYPSSSSKPPASSSASYSSSSSKASLVPITTYTTVYCSSVAPTGTAPTAKPTTIPTSLKVTPTPTPSSPPTFKGAAGHNAASLGGIVVALAAVLAL
jgi:hypothetical protein